MPCGLNSNLTYGSISVHDVLGTPMFVMSHFHRDTLRPEDLRHALVEIAPDPTASRSNSRAWTSTRGLPSTFVATEHGVSHMPASGDLASTSLMVWIVVAGVAIALGLSQWSGSRNGMPISTRPMHSAFPPARPASRNWRGADAPAPRSGFMWDPGYLR